METREITWHSRPREDQQKSEAKRAMGGICSAKLEATVIDPSFS